jgi:hypothetical protein
MKCDGSNGYAGWLLCDRVTNLPVPSVLWVDPDANEYCTVDEPVRINWRNGEVARTVHRVKDIAVDFSATTFWFERAPVLVAPLSAGRQQQDESTDRPCADCCQPEACRRICYCAAHRCGFGETAP